jgi:ribose/xylose/arabinose/galactoside ABC-type transport system permease subunit
VLVAVCAIAGDMLMRRTRLGAQLYAVGGNPEAARLSGINVDRAIFINFVIAGLGYAIRGVAMTARVSGAIAGSAGCFLNLMPSPPWNFTWSLSAAEQALGE